MPGNLYLSINGVPKAGALGLRRLVHGGAVSFPGLEEALRVPSDLLQGLLSVFCLTALFWASSEDPLGQPT